MAGNNILPYMPVWLDRLADATLEFESDARLVYFELLFAHWKRRGMLPTDPKDLRKIARLEAWGMDRFQNAWAIIQGEGKEWTSPKFEKDRFGYYNPPGREFYRRSLAAEVKRRRGHLKQHGCSRCRAVGRSVDLGDGWVRCCPECGHDLWSDFPIIPWFPDYLPTVQDKAPSRRGALPDSSEMEDLGRYLGPIEVAFLTATHQARPLNETERDLISSWHRQGVPHDLIFEIIQAKTKRRRGRPIQLLLYFAEGVAEAWAARKAAAAGAGPASPRRPVSPPPPPDAQRRPTIDCEAWKAVQGDLRKLVGQQRYKTYFKPLSVEEEDGERIVLQYPAPAFLEVLEANRGSLEELLAPRRVIFSDGLPAPSDPAS